MQGWPYIRNRWYACAWGDEIRDGLSERWLLDEPLVLYRTRAGGVTALENRCLHHYYPLSKGKIVDDAVQCGYHGFTYDCSGRCVRIPGQTAIPATARIRAYPAVERWRWVWVWMGDPALADEAQIPDFHWMDSPGWTPVGNTLAFAARHQFLNENLLDLSHVEFVHMGSIGAQDLSEFPIETRVDGETVTISRTMTDIDCPPLFAKTMGMPPKIDRWQVEVFTPPCYHVVHVAAAPAGAGRAAAAEYKVINAVVPERRNRTRYIWAVSRNYACDQAWVSDYMRDAVQKVFTQDVEVCEAIEAAMAADSPKRPELMAKVDAGVVAARRILDRLHRAERAPQAEESRAGEAGSRAAKDPASAGGKRARGRRAAGAGL